MTATPTMPKDLRISSGLLSHAIVDPLNSIVSSMTQCFVKPKHHSAKPKIMLHSGRTDGSGGHNNRIGGNGATPYHFHHSQEPHMPCCHSGLGQATSIINPYTGREINLGRPYVFQNRNFFSINLVARALTVWDTMGATLSLIPTFQPWFDVGGSFSACNLGESVGLALATLGERFSFTYPTLPIIGTLRNNTFFSATGNRGGRLQLLCHTTQAELDPYRCYAYISLETLRDYMLSEGFFTRFAPNMPSSVWFFAHSVPLAEITAPRHNDNFQVADVIVVRASVQDVREAKLTINGQTIETRTGLSGREIVFSGYTLTDSDVGNLVIGVEAVNGQQIAVNLPSVRVNVSAIPLPSIRITTPRNDDDFIARDSVAVEIEVEHAVRSEVAIGSHRQTIEHSLGRQIIRFDSYTFTSDSIGNVDISVTSENIQGMTTSDIVRVQVAKNPRSEFLIAIDPGHYIGRAGNRTPQLPDVRQTDTGLEWNWDNVTSRLATGVTPPATAPHTIPTPNGIATIITPNGAVTPSGWNVSTERDNPAFRTPERPHLPSTQATERIQMREWEFNNAVAKHLISALESKGYAVFNVAPEDDPLMSGVSPRDDDNGVGMNRRLNRVNNIGVDQGFNPFGRAADFCLSIHANAAGSGYDFLGDANVSSESGYETFYQPATRPTSSISRDYATIVHRNLMIVARAYGQRERNNPVRAFSDHALLNRGNMPVVLPECGFMTNFHDAILLMDDEYRIRVAAALSNAVDEIYELWRLGR